jgi:hypothetical protein
MLMTMREKLNIANAGNPFKRSIAGFQSPFMADYASLEIITQGCAEADAFDMVYDNGTVSVYRMFNQLDNGHIKSFDIKYIAQHEKKDHWLVCQGLVLVRDIRKIKVHEKHAKKLLIEAIKRYWHEVLQKTTAREPEEESSPLPNRRGRWVIRPP